MTVALVVMKSLERETPDALMAAPSSGSLPYAIGVARSQHQYLVRRIRGVVKNAGRTFSAVQVGESGMQCLDGDVDDARVKLLAASLAIGSAEAVGHLDDGRPVVSNDHPIT